MIGAALGMLWLLRRRGLDWGPALLGALRLRRSPRSWWSAPVTSSSSRGWPGCPSCLVGVEGWLWRRGRRELALAGLAAGLAVLCGALPLVPYFALMVVAYGLPRWLASPRRAEAALPAWGGARRAWARWSPARRWSPTLAHVPLSPRPPVDRLPLRRQLRLAAAALPVPAGGARLPRRRGPGQLVRASTTTGRWPATTRRLLVLGLLVGLLRRKAELWALFGWPRSGGAAGASATRRRCTSFFFDHVPLFGTLRCPTRALVMLLFAAPLVGRRGAAAAGRARCSVGAGARRSASAGWRSCFWARSVRPGATRG